MKPALAIARLFSKYANVEDFVHEGVQFKTLVPWVAPKAYLHILFPPAAADILQKRTAELQIPEDLTEFYSHWNGASLFAGTLDFYGLLPDKYLLNRGDWRCRFPFDLVAKNRHWRAELDKRNLFCFGSYSYDRSAVCISRDSGEVSVFAADRFDSVRGTWPGFEMFFSAELDRLSAFFDEMGRCSFPKHGLLPSATSR
jgi:hypothetical protein